MKPEHRIGRLVVHARGGRSWAPSLSVWLPIVAKVALAAGAAFLLAVIGSRAAAQSWNAEGHSVAESASTGGLRLTERAPDPPTGVGGLRSQGTDAGVVQALAQTDHERAETDSAPQPAPGGGTPGALPPDGKIALNAAVEEQLVRLPGIGPARARAILALRDRIGRFRSVDQLRRVKGIGRKTLQRIAPLIVLDLPKPKADGKDGG